MNDGIVQVEGHFVGARSRRLDVASVPDELVGSATEAVSPTVVGANLIFTASAEGDIAGPDSGNAIGRCRLKSLNNRR